MLAYLIIYNPTLKPEKHQSALSVSEGNEKEPQALTGDQAEDDEELAHMIYYSSNQHPVTRDKMLRQIGLAKGLNDFARRVSPLRRPRLERLFSVVAPATHTSSLNSNLVTLELEYDFFIHVKVDLLNVPVKPNIKPGSVRTKPKKQFIPQEYLESSLLRAYADFKLLNGPLGRILEEEGRAKLEKVVERFFNVWKSNWEDEMEAGVVFENHLGGLISISPSPQLSTMNEEFTIKEPHMIITPSHLHLTSQPFPLTASTIALTNYFQSRLPAPFQPSPPSQDDKQPLSPGSSALPNTNTSSKDTSSAADILAEMTNTTLSWVGLGARNGTSTPTKPLRASSGSAPLVTPVISPHSNSSDSKIVKAKKSNMELWGGIGDLFGVRKALGAEQSKQEQEDTTVPKGDLAIPGTPRIIPPTPELSELGNVPSANSESASTETTASTTDPTPIITATTLESPTEEKEIVSPSSASTKSSSSVMADTALDNSALFEALGEDLPLPTSLPEAALPLLPWETVYVWLDALEDRQGPEVPLKTTQKTKVDYYISDSDPNSPFAFIMLSPSPSPSVSTSHPSTETMSKYLQRFNLSSKVKPPRLHPTPPPALIYSTTSHHLKPTQTWRSPLHRMMKQDSLFRSSKLSRREETLESYAKMSIGGGWIVTANKMRSGEDTEEALNAEEIMIVHEGKGLTLTDAEDRLKYLISTVEGGGFC